MPSTNDLRLGRKIIAALVEYLESSHTWSQLKYLLFKHELDARFSGPNKLDALGNVFYPLATEEATAHEVKRAVELVEEMSQEWYQTIKAHKQDEFSVLQHRAEHASQQYERFMQALRADGLDLIEGRIVPFLSPTVTTAQEQGSLEVRLQDLGFATSRRHLEQAIDNAARGNWEAANGQIGSFLESLCEEIASKLHSGPSDPPTRGEARKFLEERGFLDKTEAELLKSFFQVLHSPGGRHAGTSSQDDCHRRRLIALALGNYYLERLSPAGITRLKVP